MRKRFYFTGINLNEIKRERYLTQGLLVWAVIYAVVANNGWLHIIRDLIVANT